MTSLWRWLKLWLWYRWLRWRRWLLVAAGLGVIAALWTAWMLVGRYASLLYTPETLAETPHRPVAIVFGAGYWPSGRLSAILQDRMDAAIELYRAGRVDKLLLSGDNRFVDYNEPGQMLNYALAQGVPREALVLDYAGRRTYDTCYRARDIFRVDNVILVTQRYHQPRALHTCRVLGLDAIGYVADRQPYPRRALAWYWLREGIALWRAQLDLYLYQPVPVLGEPLPIFP